MPDFVQLEPDRKFRKRKTCEARPPDVVKGLYILRWLPEIREPLDWWQRSEQPTFPVSPEETEVRWRAVRKPDAELWAIVRGIRDRLLAACDWTQCLDSPAHVNKAEWAVYRQALRDIPQTYSDPVAVVWPTEPGA